MRLSKFLALAVFAPLGALLLFQPFPSEAQVPVVDPPITTLKGVPVPPVVERITGLPLIPNFVKDEAAAILLGKALFWDRGVGSDGQACASCHANAGMDIRRKNQLNQGLIGGNGVFDPTASGGAGGPNYTLVDADFPFHQFADPNDRDSAVIFDSDDVASSQGVMPSTFIDIVLGSATDNCTVDGPPDPKGFQVTGINTRRVEPRNTPTVINAAHEFRIFWDGRANNIFNAVNPFGRRDPDARILQVQPDGSVAKVKVEFTNSALASQATGPPLSEFEMSCAGRTFFKLGKKMLNLPPLATQVVHTGDSVLGPVSADDGTLTIPGLTTDYSTLIEAAFADNLWDSNKLFDAAGNEIGVGAPANTNQFTLKEANFSLFWGISIQLYEATLVSDDSPFDQFEDDPVANAGAMTEAQKRGREVFEGQGQCIACHATAMFTKASSLHLIDENNEEGLVERMLMGQEKFRYMCGGGGSVHDGNKKYTLGLEAGSFDLPSANPAEVGGDIQITLHKNGLPKTSPCHYGPVDSFLLNPDGNLAVLDAEFHAPLKNGDPADCGTGVTVTVVDKDFPVDVKPKDHITVVKDGELFPFIDGNISGGDFDIDTAALYDNGHYNIGTRPTEEDPGIGGEGPFGNPLSFARQYLDMLLGLGAPDPFQVNECSFEIPFDLVHDLNFFPGGFDPVPCDTDDDGIVDFITGRPTNNAANQLPIGNARVAVDGAFGVPTLRNIELFGPHFHNGGNRTLEEVVRFYNRGADFALANEPNTDPDIQPLMLTEQQIADLVAFLESLTDQRVACQLAPFDQPGIAIFDGHPGDETFVTDDGTGQATNGFQILPPTGAGGLPAEGLPCLTPF